MRKTEIYFLFVFIGTSKMNMTTVESHNFFRNINGTMKIVVVLLRMHSIALAKMMTLEIEGPPEGI